MINGKIVIIFSLLCALFHIIGTEKAFAHLIFLIKKNPELRDHREIHTPQRPNPEIITIEYLGNYIDAKSGNTSVINRDGNVFLEYIHIIKDDEIQSLINSQTDDNAKRGVAIKCKENQIF